MDSQSSDVARQKKRSANFTPEERRLLISLANKYSYIIENKKTDAVTTAEKKKGWAVIEQLFNASAKGPHRDAKALKMKYEGVKKELRKKDDEWKVTGGGSLSTRDDPIPEEEVILRDTIALTVRGLQPQQGDDDCDEIQVGVSPEKLQVEVVPNEYEMVDVDWSSMQPRMYQTEKDPALLATSPAARCSPTVLMTAPVVTSPAVEPSTSAGTRSTTPLLLTTTPNTNESRRRPVISKKRSMRSSAGKFEELAEKKLALTEVKMEITAKKSRLVDLKLSEAEARASEAKIRLLIAEQELAAREVSNI